MISLKQSIESLDDDDALEVVNYLARWMQNDVELSKKIPSEILEIADSCQQDIQASKILMSNALEYDVSLNCNEGQIARNLLATMAKNKEYISKIQEAINHPRLRIDSGTLLYVAILFFLTIEFEYEYETGNGDSKKRFRIGRKSTPSVVRDLLDKILGK